MNYTHIIMMQRKTKLKKVSVLGELNSAEQ